MASQNIRTRGREATIQAALTTLHLTYIALGALAVAHHVHRLRLALFGRPLPPGF
jgi:hypothetical protein